MKIAIPDDYQDAVRTLDSFQKLNGQQVVILHGFSQDFYIAFRSIHPYSLSIIDQSGRILYVYYCR